MILIASHPAVPAWVTVLFGLLLVALILCLALEEKLHAKKSIIVGAFAVICLFLGTVTDVISFQDVVVGSYEAEVPDEPVELKYIVDESSNETETVQFGGNAAEGTDEGQSGDGSSHAAGEEGSEEAEEKVVIHIGGEEVSMPAYIPGIDWSVIAIILGSSLFVDVTSRSGLFSWIAIKATKFSRGDPLWLLILYGVMTVVFSAVLNNVTAMIIVGSLTVVSLEKLGRQQQLLGFLLVEGLLTNIGGLLTLISSVPNIIVGTTANISFATFFIKSAPYVCIATAMTLWMGTWLFKIRSLRGESEKKEAMELVSGFDENDGISSPAFFKMAVVMLGLCIILIAGTSALPVISKLGMGFVALSMAAAMLLMFRAEVDKFYRAVDWDLIGFFMGLFVVIHVMEHAQVLTWIGHQLESVMANVKAENASASDATVLLLGSSVFSSVTDNIPLSAMLASILGDFQTPESSGLWWSVIFGANLGGNLTPIGSASTLVAVTIMHRHKVKMSFLDFVKYAFPFAVAQIIVAVVYVIFVVPLLPSL